MNADWAMLVDTTLCTGCDDCVVACKEQNQLGEDVPRRWKSRIDDLSSTRYTTVIQHAGDRFVRQFCRHCLEPACVSACLVGALQKTPEGAVTYDADRCMGCRYCMTACPYGIPRYDWEQPVPYIRKCDLCRDRVLAGEQPACVEACQEHAVVFGARDELIAEAQRRIESSPDKYLDQVYGEEQVGGTSVLYVSDVSLDILSYKPDLGDRPLPELTWAALSKVPPLVVGMAGLMTAVWWITDRRIQLAAESAASATEPGSSDEGDREP